MPLPFWIALGAFVAAAAAALGVGLGQWAVKQGRR